MALPTVTHDPGQSRQGHPELPSPVWPRKSANAGSAIDCVIDCDRFDRQCPSPTDPLSVGDYARAADSALRAYLVSLADSLAARLGRGEVAAVQA